MAADRAFAVVLVNYNRHEETRRCVESLRASICDQENVAIFIVDNSDLGALPDIPGTTILRPGLNLGLAPAWTLAFNLIATTEAYSHVVFLNNDVVVASDFFAMLDQGIAKWGAHTTFGGRIYRADNQRTIWSRGGSINVLTASVSHRDEGVPDSQVIEGDFETGHISGCCLIVPVDVLQSIGGPDPNFFFRGEEWDLSLRLTRAGCRLVLLDRLRLWHTISASHDRFSPEMLYLAYRAKVLFAMKHQPKAWFPFWYLLGLVYAVTLAPRKFAGLAGHRIRKVRRALLQAFYDGLFERRIRPRHIS